MNLGLAKPADVLDAICFQNEQRSLGQSPGPIGQILLERGVLTPDDLTRIMEEIEQRTRALEIPGFRSLELVERTHTTLQFRGETVGTRRSVVIRILRFGLAESPDDTKRFLAESGTLSRLDHPNVVKVLSTGELEGIPYLVLENVSGPTLRAHLDENGPMSEESALDVFVQVASGLEHAHALEVMHGSVRPGAVLLPRIGPVKLTDFALFDWCSFAAAQGAARLDSPYYLSPELARKSARVTARSDVYSLGATLYHMLTGRPPFRGNYMDVLRQHMKRPAPDPRTHAPGISEATALLVMGMLAKAPENRPPGMSEVIRLAHRPPTPGTEAETETGLPSRLRPRRRD